MKKIKQKDSIPEILLGIGVIGLGIMNIMNPTQEIGFIIMFVGLLIIVEGIFLK